MVVDCAHMPTSVYTLAEENIVITYSIMCESIVKLAIAFLYQSNQLVFDDWPYSTFVENLFDENSLWLLILAFIYYFIFYVMFRQILCCPSLF